MAESQGQTDNTVLQQVQQLSSVKKQLDDELEHLISSFTKLRAAQFKFHKCLKSITDGVSEKSIGKSILVPLTSSLYVPGTITDTRKVIVDVGTGFYVEKTTKDALIFYDGKIEDLSRNLKELENVVQGKSNNRGIIEEVLRQKMVNNLVSST